MFYLVLFWIVTVTSLQVDDRSRLNDLVIKNLLINKFRDQVRFSNYLSDMSFFGSADEIGKHGKIQNICCREETPEF